MADLPETFSVADVPESERNFEPIPAGVYKMQVIESTMADTKSGSGQILKLTVEVIEGQYANRRIFENLNIRNDNPQTQSIAQRALADLCLTLGIAQLRNSDVLHFKPFSARVIIQPDKSGQYGPQNRIRYTPGKATGAPVAAPQQGRPPARSQTAQGAAKPWSQPKKVEAEEDAPF